MRSFAKKCKEKTTLRANSLRLWRRVKNTVHHERTASNYDECVRQFELNLRDTICVALAPSIIDHSFTTLISTKLARGETMNSPNVGSMALKDLPRRRSGPHL